ncbi:PP0621 family protein [Paraburkholderia phenoliruptrix]|uniref:PP0621 family protein n=1 Tax=Paraburkholderia phenoliruptrix TaxID=252970 RepID=UPI001C6EB868|nr:PP0621 family protein [Paraburkholderia phenoliruptrix]MBW9107488.1 deaminase [Paraburkholderia phenoliruptrix]MBW9132442.1 deaminase [Paraburkholderia ginsengiterrae]
MREIFLLIVLFVVGQWLAKALRRHDAHTAQRSGTSGARRGATNANGAAGASGAPQLAEPMIRCVECGVHAPKGDSVIVAGQAFCSAAHAQRHGARPTGRDAR